MSIRDNETPQFRVVSFLPNPFGGDRVTLGVVVRLADGSVRAVEAPHTPSANCIGGDQRRASFLLGRKLLHKVRDFDALPGVFGPQMLLSNPVDIPSDDPVGFASKLVFGSREGASTNEKNPRATERRSYGRSYFRSKGIAKVVKSDYRPQDNYLAPLITHYVLSDHSPPLLMEPLSALRGNSVGKDVSDVYARFSAYRTILGEQPVMIAYLLHGLGDDPRAEKVGMWSRLSEVAEVVDISRGVQERDFLGRIRDAAGLETLNV